MDIETLESVEQLWQREVDRRKRADGGDNFPKLPDLPAGRYVDPAFYELENTRLWPKTWIFAGHVSELPAAGSYLKRETPGASIIILRGKDNQIRAFHNVCTHRGAALMREEAGKVDTINCAYHCWSFGLDGKLLFVPDEHDFAGLDKCTKGLREIHCEQYRGLIFFNLDREAEPLNAFLGSLAYSLADVDLEGSQMIQKITVPGQCNWKCVQDAFSETYHVRYVHAQSVNLTLDQKYTARYTMQRGHNAMIVKARANAESGQVNVFDRASEGSAQAQADGMREITSLGQRSYNIFPNLTVPISANLFPIMAIWPTGINSCELEIRFMKTPTSQSSGADDAAVAEAFKAIIAEDLGALEGMPKALASGAIDGLVLGQGEQFLTNYHQELDRVIGRDVIPQELRTEYVELPHIDADQAD